MKIIRIYPLFSWNFIVMLHIIQRAMSGKILEEKACKAELYNTLRLTGTQKQCSVCKLVNLLEHVYFTPNFIYGDNRVLQ